MIILGCSILSSIVKSKLCLDLTWTSSLGRTVTVVGCVRLTTTAISPLGSRISWLATTVIGFRVSRRLFLFNAQCFTDFTFLVLCFVLIPITVGRRWILRGRRRRIRVTCCLQLGQRRWILWIVFRRFLFRLLGIGRVNGSRFRWNHWSRIGVRRWRILSRWIVHFFRCLLFVLDSLG